MAWREYHEATKHSRESLQFAPHFLDWANMPDPFRHYEGVPVLDLPADPASPDIPMLTLLHGAHGSAGVNDGAAFLSQLLFYSASISASKLVPATEFRYALRVNPSSGNLHPTEFHFLTRGLKDWPDGLYHYRPSSHMAEQRALGDFERKVGDSSAPIVFILTSIVWREAWKYGSRAYRYCLHDCGHAWEALALAARAMGCECHAAGDFPDDEVAQACEFSVDEWPMLIVELKGGAIPLRQEDPTRQPDAGDTIWYGGQANRLSKETIAYPLIQRIHMATKLLRAPVSLEPAPPGSGDIKLPAPAESKLGFGEVVRKRRSALNFVGGKQSMSLRQLSAILAEASAPFIQLYLFAHRIEGLEPGVYKHWPDGAGLERVKGGDQRVAAAGLSLGQELAGNACVAFSMIGDLERAARVHGDRGYRFVHFGAGAIGQRLYLAAEALGLGATGIGAFYDEEVHRYLNLKPEQGQVVYHFAIGYPVPDPRIDASRVKFKP